MRNVERQRSILDFALTGLMRRRWRNAVLVCSYALVISLLASVLFLSAALRREAAETLKDSPEIVVQRMSAGRMQMMPVADLEALGGIRGVADVKGRLWGYYYDPVLGANYTLIVPDPGFKPAPPPGGIVIGSAVARDRAAGVGDVFPFNGYDGRQRALKISAVLPESSELVAADLVLITEPDFRALFGMSDALVTDAALTARNPLELATIARKVVERIPSARPIIRDEVLRTYEAVFTWRSGMMLVLLAGAGAAFVIFAWDRASGLSAEEKREIGILKAIGWETDDVLWLKFWEGTAVSLTSFLLGTVLAYAHVFFFDSALFAPALKGWSVLYPNFRLVPHVNAYEIASLFFLTVVPYTAATIVPSWRAATADPDEVMRQ